MEVAKKKIKRKRNPIQYKITAIFNKNDEDIRKILEKIFVNYCMDKFEKWNLYIWYNF